MLLLYSGIKKIVLIETHAMEDLFQPMISDGYSSAINNDSAIGMQRLAGDKAAILASKEYKARCNLARLTWTTHGGSTELLLRRGSHSGWNKRCPNFSALVKGHITGNG
jgi:hypothetical protein